MHILIAAHPAQRSLDGQMKRPAATGLEAQIHRSLSAKVRAEFVCK